MNHLSDEDLVLQYYGEPAEGVETGAHLASCEACAARFQELQRVLNKLDETKIPERGENYGAEVWRRLEPRLARPISRGQWRAWGAIAAMLIVGMTGYWMGRKAAVPVEPGGVKERILLVALTDHLERSQMVLAEIENADSEAKGGLDLTFERSQAEDLLDANRLYRLTAAANGNLAAASLLDDLERVLVDIAHAPDRANRAEIETLRGRIEDQGLTFKVKVFSSGLAADQGKGRM
jgi:anti-sigma factor RsiW